MNSGGLQWRRLPLLMLGALGLVTGLWAGLARLGIAAPPLSPLAHGPLMVSGFLGTVISLERAVAARATWAFAGPLCCGMGTVAMLLGQPEFGAALLTAGSAVVVIVLTRVLVKEPVLHHGVLVVAALSWLWGNGLLLLGKPVFVVVWPWMLFLVGTIAAERLELTRVLPRSRTAVILFLLAFGVMTLGVVTGEVRVLFGGALGLAAWLLRFDLARRTVRQHGLVRFIAVALLLGYGWLAIAGGLGLTFGNPIAGPRYDALLHATFVGFVFSMIFGHAPIIVPAVLGVRVPFHSRFYVHLVVLHASLVLRLTGDLFDDFALRRAGSWGNVIAIAVFLASTVAAAVQSRPAAQAAHASGTMNESP